MDKRKSYQVVLEIPQLHGNKDKYTSHSEEDEIQGKIYFNIRTNISFN